VIYILDNPPDLLRLEQVHDLFRRKCSVKGLPIPSVAELVRIAEHDAELRSEWANMLAYQPPELPLLDILLQRLPSLLAWIERPTMVLPEMALRAAPVYAGELSIVEPGIRYWGAGLPLEAIRFAGANRLLIQFRYHGTQRTAEPYSLRRAGTGDVLLYAWEVGGSHIKAFKIQEMSEVRSTQTPFTPRYRIEVAATGPFSIPASAAPALSRAFPATSGRRQHAAPRTPPGPTYVFRCPHCQKEFRHTKKDPALRKHKTDYGLDCTGRRGYLDRVDY